MERTRKNPYILTAFENTKESAKNLHSNTFTKGETLPLNSKPNSTTTANKSQEGQENNKWVLTAYKKDEALSQADLHQAKRNDPASSFIAEPTSKPNSTPKEMKNQEPNIQPIKEFGTNYAEFYHDGANAIKKLLIERQGQVAGAFEREELGDIDLVWGEFKVVKGEIKGYGLSKIEAKHLNDFAIFEGSTP